MDIFLAVLGIVCTVYGLAWVLYKFGSGSDDTSTSRNSRRDDYGNPF